MTVQPIWSISCKLWSCRWGTERPMRPSSSYIRLVPQCSDVQTDDATAHGRSSSREAISSPCKPEQDIGKAHRRYETSSNAPSICRDDTAHFVPCRHSQVRGTGTKLAGRASSCDAPARIFWQMFSSTCGNYDVGILAV